jgi:hypothetical protein
MQTRIAVLLAGLLLALTTPALGAPSPSPGGVAVIPDPKSTHTNPAHTSIRVGVLAVGRVFTETATVVNTTSSTQDVYVYPADGTPARGGGYAYATRGTRMTGVGAWLTVSKTRMTIPSNGRVAISIRLQAPATAPNGLRVGAVVVEPVIAEPGTIVTVTRYAMPVSMTVTGGVTPTAGPSRRPGSSAAPSPTGGPLEVSDLEPRPRGSRLCPRVRVTNSGATPAAPRLTIRGDGWFSDSERSVTVDPVAPGTSKQVDLPCVRRPIGPGKLTVRADDAYVGAQLFWIPLPLLISLLLLLLLIGALLTTFARGWLKQREGDDPPDASPPSSFELDADHP